MNFCSRNSLIVCNTEVSYGINNSAMFRAEDIVLDLKKTIFVVNIKGQKVQLNMSSIIMFIMPCCYVAASVRIFLK